MVIARKKRKKNAKNIKDGFFMKSLKQEGSNYWNEK